MYGRERAREGEREKKKVLQSDKNNAEEWSLSFVCSLFLSFLGRNNKIQNGHSGRWVDGVWVRSFLPFAHLKKIKIWQMDNTPWVCVLSFHI